MDAEDLIRDRTRCTLGVYQSRLAGTVREVHLKLSHQLREIEELRARVRLGNRCAEPELPQRAVTTPPVET